MPLLERNRESFHPKNGISWYKGEKTSELDTLSEELWLPKHSHMLVDSLDRHGGITLIGTVGAGKSTLLYGARAIMRSKGIPYVNINGHYSSTKADEIIKAINSAEDNGMTVLYDSADYLAGSTRKVRSLSLTDHLARNLAILKRLVELRQRGGNLMLSSHHQDWVNDRADVNLRSAWDRLTAHTLPVQVDITLPTLTERAVLLRKMGFEEQSADYIAKLPDDPQFMNYIVHKKGDKRYLDCVQDALSRYEMLKLLARDSFQANIPVLKAIKKTLTTHDSEELSWDIILDFIGSKTYLLLFYTKL